MRTLLLSFAVWLASAVAAFASSSVPVDTGRVVATLLSSHYAVTPGQTFDVALRTELDDKWHTYWRNPGDSGEPVSIQWSLPDGVSVGPITWPLPDTIATGPIINYGFEGAPLFVQRMSVPEGASVGDVLQLSADVYYLVCKDICVPESGTLSMAVTIADAPEVNARNAASIDAARAAAPVVADDISAGMVATGDALVIEISGLPEGRFGEAQVFPYAQDVLGHSDAQDVTVLDGGLRIDTTASYGWEDGITEDQRALVTFVQDGERVGRIIDIAPNTSLGLAAGSASGAPFGLLSAVLGALLGGLILNLMPCVFPVISLKALSLAKSAHGERRDARRQAWAYTVGVLASFAVLVAVLLAFKASGAALGWGFQLQNPVVVGLLALLLFAVGLNLIGAFEIAGGGYQGTGASLAGKGGLTGSFFTGVLAVLVATPCTAPFMAAAIGYALAQPALATFVVFMALGLGFAAPFVLLAYAPGLLAKLPKPGPWMVRLREVLSFPMFAAALWLAWVVGNQIGVNGMAAVLLGMLALGLAVWMFQRGTVARVVGVVALLLAVALPTVAGSVLAPNADEATSAKLAADAWSPERVAELRAQGRPVFVDFTADWCVTCKMNEGAVLTRAEVRDAFERTNTAFLVADWTNKNDTIARELQAYGRAGVPLYLYFPAGDDSVRGQVLPQVLTVRKVVSTLEGR